MELKSQKVRIENESEKTLTKKHFRDLMVETYKIKKKKNEHEHADPRNNKPHKELLQRKPYQGTS